MLHLFTWITFQFGLYSSAANMFTAQFFMTELHKDETATTNQLNFQHFCHFSHFTLFTVFFVLLWLLHSYILFFRSFILRGCIL